MKMIDGFPRRRRLDHMTHPERLINEAVRAIETEMGCDERLTRAQQLLSEAANLVADVFEETGMIGPALDPSKEQGK